MFEQDYIMRMIHDLVRMLAKLLLGKDTVTVSYTHLDVYKRQIVRIITKEGK